MYISESGRKKEKRRELCFLRREIVSLITNNEDIKIFRKIESENRK